MRKSAEDRKEVALPSAPGPQNLLGGLRIIDLSASLGAAFCTSLLYRLGARVTRVETGPWPAGPKTAFADEHLARSPVYAPYVNVGKEIVEVDLQTEAGRRSLNKLLAESHVLVEDWRLELLATAGLERETVRRDFPGLIVASVTPFGRSGARSEWTASDLTLFHGGGPGFATPGLVADPGSMPPIRAGSHQGAFVSGLTAAINVCAAVLLVQRNPGQGSVGVDFSSLEAMANVFRQSLGTFAYYGGGLNRDLARGRGAGGTADHRNIRCKDGWINLSWANIKQWETLKDLLGNPEWMEDERLASPGLRHRNWPLVVPRLEEWALEYDKDSLFYLCQGLRIPCAQVNDGADLLESEALSSRSFWAESDDGRATKLPDIHSQFEGMSW
jgi:crotonobetainyl-CoA:carnitine CoA-transferase CaiB-like acyl-CoA transferase